MAKGNPGKQNVRYEVIVQEDPDSGDIILPIPEVLLKNMGWKEGDDVDINIDKDGKIYLQKK